MSNRKRPESADELSNGQQYLLRFMARRYAMLDSLRGSYAMHDDMTGRHATTSTVSTLRMWELIRLVNPDPHRISSFDTYCITPKGWEWAMELRGADYPMPIEVTPDEMARGYGVGNAVKADMVFPVYDGEPAQGIIFNATYTGKPIGWLQTGAQGIAVRRNNYMHFYLDKDDKFIVHKGSLDGYEKVAPFYLKGAKSLRYSAREDTSKQHRLYVPGVGRFIAENNWEARELGTNKILPFKLSSSDQVLLDSTDDYDLDIAIDHLYGFMVSINAFAERNTDPMYDMRQIIIKAVSSIFVGSYGSRAMYQASSALARLIEAMKD